MEIMPIKIPGGFAVTYNKFLAVFVNIVAIEEFLILNFKV